MGHFIYSTLPSFYSSVLKKLLPSILFAGLLFGLSSHTQANFPDPRAPLPVEIQRTAVHIPTGCLAKVIFNDGTFVQAFIIDPDCLPRGVLFQPMPGSSGDFTVIDYGQQQFYAPQAPRGVPAPQQYNPPQYYVPQTY